ncbi:CH216-49N3 [Biomphalaria pfeifferi]|uniref:CH216-49N3 n=1 Tax=Biomphalaria pfeifferi TaxID=112525 RepID=A0AAD8EUP3_BIOPF|nr:CH216-49N3 [Biomphalaria pfeifferi]
MELKSCSFTSKEPHVASEPQVADPGSRIIEMLKYCLACTRLTIGKQIVFVHWIICSGRPHLNIIAYREIGLIVTSIPALQDSIFRCDHAAAVAAVTIIAEVSSSSIHPLVAPLFENATPLSSTHCWAVMQQLITSQQNKMADIVAWNNILVCRRAKGSLPIISAFHSASPGMRDGEGG